jgi:hypothetical protein
MSRRIKVALLVFATAALSIAVPVVLTACKQGDGQRCQIQDDCEDGLICSPGDHVCRQNVTTTPADAMIDADIDAGSDI